MNRKIFAVSVLALFLDQISKIMIGIFLRVDESLDIIPNFFSFKYMENYGAAWSILNNRTGLLIAFSIFALVIIINYMYNFKSNWRNNIAFGILLGGISGNLIDRLFIGYVRDFLAFKLGSYNYPVFNLADVFIVIGVLLLVIAILKGEDRNEAVDSGK